LREGGGYARGGAIKADGDEEGRGGVGENEVEANEGAAAAEEEAGEEKWLNHYSSMHSTLIVGDGDFSFSLALATAFGSGANLVATTLDTYGSSASIDSASFCCLKCAIGNAYWYQYGRSPLAFSAFGVGISGAIGVWI
jgi:hypothetical protein